MQAFSGISSNIQPCSGIFREIMHIEPYSDILRIMCNPLQPCHIQNPGLLGLEASSKACRPCKISRHIQSPGIVRKVYSTISKDV